VTILARPRATAGGRRLTAEESAARARLLARLTNAGALDEAEKAMLEEALGVVGQDTRSERDIARLHAIVTGRGGRSLEHAGEIARQFAGRASRVLAGRLRDLPDSVHKRFLRELVHFVIHRSH
jgi:hypothetical protein